MIFSKNHTPRYQRTKFVLASRCWHHYRHRLGHRDDFHRRGQTVNRKQYRRAGIKFVDDFAGRSAWPGNCIFGSGSAQTLTNEDLDALESIDGIVGISPKYPDDFKLPSTGNNTNTTVSGFLPRYWAVRNLSLAAGVFITEAQARTIGRKAVIGATVAKDLFGEENPLKKTVRIGGSTFHVVGILVGKGGAGFSGPDDMVLVPLSTMQKVLSGVDHLTAVSVSVAEKERMNEVQLAITDALTRKHKVTEPDFSVISQADILSTLTQVITTFTLFLASIAGISLVVGGIGIMNMMLTTVTERTREIGLRKAIGAKRRDINLQFLFEAVLLTFIGGVVGVFLLANFFCRLLGLIDIGLYTCRAGVWRVGVHRNCFGYPAHVRRL